MKPHRPNLLDDIFWLFYLALASLALWQLIDAAPSFYFTGSGDPVRHIRENLGHLLLGTCTILVLVRILLKQLRASQRNALIILGMIWLFLTILIPVF